MRLTLFTLAVMATTSSCLAQQLKRPEPVPILKQISKQNDDGSYSFGYEAGDGSYKIETKYTDGSVQGKYGYVDEAGKLREVEYGASKSRGFEPVGNDINVPPPTVSKNENVAPLADGEEDDGQYREDPRIYESKEYRSRPQAGGAARRPVSQFRFQEPAVQQPQQPQYQEPIQNSVYQQPAQKQSFFSFQPQQQQQVYQQPAQPAYSGFQQQTFPRFQNYQPTYSYQQPQYSGFQQQPATSQYFSSYNGHPSVRNFDIGTGSYSINYSGR